MQCETKVQTVSARTFNTFSKNTRWGKTWTTFKKTKQSRKMYITLTKNAKPRKFNKLRETLTEVKVLWHSTKRGIFTGDRFPWERKQMGHSKSIFAQNCQYFIPYHFINFALSV